MNYRNLNSIPLFAIAYIAVFLAAYPNRIRTDLGVQINLLPPLMVYCGLNSGWGTLTVVAIMGGFLFDSLSANPLGLTTLTLFLIGFLVRWNRDTILRDERFAQFVLGLMAGAAAPVAGLVILWTLGRTPLVGIGSIWQIASMALIGGAATPVLFWILERVKSAFSYRPIQEPSFRSDWEIKRGRM